MGNFWRGLVRYSGQFFRWFFRLVGDLLGIVMREVASGIGAVAKVSAPYVIGAGVAWYLCEYQPQLFQQILTLVVMAFGLRILWKNFFPKRKK